MSTTPSRPYVFTTYQYLLQDRPLEQAPIQRLQKEGAEVLDSNELLHIALGRGDALNPILKEYGAKFLTTLHSVNDIVEALSLDRVQAVRLLAILELGRRLYSNNQGSLITIRGIEDVYENYRFMANLAKEQLRVLLLNSRYQLIHEEVLAIGGTENLHISPKDVFQSAIERRVTGIILIHNHPSANPEPSEADIRFTKAIQKAGDLLGISLLDHVIIGSTQAVSCLPLSKNDQKQ